MCKCVIPPLMYQSEQTQDHPIMVAAEEIQVKIIENMKLIDTSAW